MQGVGYKWFALQTQVGHERAVLARLEEIIAGEQSGGLSSALVPEEEFEVVTGQKKVRKRRTTMPGYVLVAAQPERATIMSLLAVQGVHRILGGPDKPQSLSRAEVDRLTGVETREVRHVKAAPFVEGQSVEVVHGPFTGFAAVVEDVMADRGKAMVMLHLFGRPTKTEMDFAQIAAVG